MVNSVSTASPSTLLQSLQATKSAKAVSAADVENPSSASAATKSTAAKYDSVEISAAGKAYAATRKTDNATLLKSLNTADSSGMSYVQQQRANLRAGVSAAALMGNFGANSASEAGGARASFDMSALLSSVSQGKQTNTILRNAGASALGLGGITNPGGTTGSTDSSTPTDSTESTTDSEKSDLSKYSLRELGGLLGDGTISAEEFLSEVAAREKSDAAQETTDAAQSGNTAATVVGAAAK